MRVAQIMSKALILTLLLALAAIVWAGGWRILAEQATP